MRTYGAAVALFFLVASNASAESLSESWRVEGLSNPESVLFDPTQNVLYVSNIAGEAMAKDGKGFISRLSPDGKILTLKWTTGLNAPKGLALVGERLFVSDIDELVAVDTKTGKIAKRWPAAGAKFLNDVAADEAAAFSSRTWSRTRSGSSTATALQSGWRARALRTRTASRSRVTS
jgi:DNA-binding beta-propeller fold protein YncE